MLRQSGKQSEQVVGEAVDGVGGVVLQAAQVDDQMDGRLV